MKKLIWSMGDVSCAISPTIFTISCFPGDITFKNKLSDGISKIYLEESFEDLSPDFLLNYIYNKYRLDTEEKQKGISVTNISQDSENINRAYASVSVSEDNQALETETFKMTIMLNSIT